MDVLYEWPLLLLNLTMYHHTELWLEFCHTALFILTPIGISFLLKVMCQLYETNPFPRWDTSFFCRCIAIVQRLRMIRMASAAGVNHRSSVNVQGPY